MTNPKDGTRTELVAGLGRYPTERVWTAEGTWIIPPFHLGAWTALAAPEGTNPHILEGGNRGLTSRDEMHVNVIAIAQKYKYQVTGDSAAFLRAVQKELDPGTNPRATGFLGEADLSSRLAQMAHESVAWLNSSVAPVGRHFVLEDALYLIADSNEGPVS